MDFVRAALGRVLTPSSERPSSVSSGASTPSTADPLPASVVVPSNGLGLVTLSIPYPAGSLGLELETSLTGRIVCAADCVVAGVRVWRGDELTHVNHIQVADVLDFSRALALLKLAIQQKACVLTVRRAEFVPRHRNRAESVDSRPRSGAARESVGRPLRPRDDGSSILSCAVARSVLFLMQAAPEVARAALVAPPARAGGGPRPPTAQGPGDSPAVEALHALFASQDLDLSDLLSPAQPVHVRAVATLLTSALRHARGPFIPVSDDVAQTVSRILSRSGSPEKRRLAALSDAFAALDARAAGTLRTVGLLFRVCERRSGQPHSVAAVLAARGCERPQRSSSALPLPDPALVRSVGAALGGGHSEVLSVLLGVAASPHLHLTPAAHADVTLLTHTASFLRVWAAQQHGAPSLLEHGASRAEVEDVGEELAATRATLLRLLSAEGSGGEEGDSVSAEASEAAADAPSAGAEGEEGVPPGTIATERAVWTSLDRYGPRLVRYPAACALPCDRHAPALTRTHTPSPRCRLLHSSSSCSQTRTRPCASSPPSCDPCCSLRATFGTLWPVAQWWTRSCRPCPRPPQPHSPPCASCSPASACPAASSPTASAASCPRPPGRAPSHRRRRPPPSERRRQRPTAPLATWALQRQGPRPRGPPLSPLARAPGRQAWRLSAPGARSFPRRPRQRRC